MVPFVDATGIETLISTIEILHELGLSRQWDIWGACDSRPGDSQTVLDLRFLLGLDPTIYWLRWIFISMVRTRLAYSILLLRDHRIIIMIFLTYGFPVQTIQLNPLVSVDMWNHPIPSSNEVMVIVWFSIELNEIIWVKPNLLHNNQSHVLACMNNRR